VLIVPGGGELVDAIRRLDACQRLGEEAAHWLAVRALQVTAHYLVGLFRRGEIVSSWAECPPLWSEGKVPVLDALHFLQADDGRSGALPHRWAVTSDAIAARLAVVSGARQLVLLKSVDVPRNIAWAEAARRGWVDEWFGRVLEQASPMSQPEVQIVNLRARR
jgi:aspartokinase-like uncharacterized kinase